MSVEIMRSRMIEARNKALIADRLHKRGVARLEKFSLLTRIAAFWKFSDFRKRLKRLEWDRFAYTSVSLHLARSIKFYERKLKQKQLQGR